MSEPTNAAETAARLRPYGDWVLVQQDPLAAMTASGRLHRPDRVADWTAYGRVVAIGPGPRNDRGERVPPDFAVADHVIFDWRPSHEQQEVERIAGKRTILLRADEIVAVIEHDEAA